MLEKGSGAKFKKEFYKWSFKNGMER